jgi:anti-sigma regulatory factor (Ser/Thr protein kinase)
MESVRLSFTHDPDGASIRQTANRVLAGWQTPDLIADTLVVITELIHNVVTHTPDGGELVISRRGDGVLIEVLDDSSDLPAACLPDARRIGGRGLLLVDGLARNWGSHRTGTGKTVWAQMPLDHAA